MYTFELSIPSSVERRLLRLGVESPGVYERLRDALRRLNDGDTQGAVCVPDPPNPDLCELRVAGYGIAFVKLDGETRPETGYLVTSIYPLGPSVAPDE